MSSLTADERKALRSAWSQNNLNQMSNNKSTSGMSAALQSAKRQAEVLKKQGPPSRTPPSRPSGATRGRDITQDEIAVLKWISDVTGDECNNIHTSLKSGVVLCKLINKIRPKSVIRINRFNQPFMHYENIKNFVLSCKALGMEDRDVFDTLDLYEANSLKQVVHCLLKLAEISRNIPTFKGPYLDVSSIPATASVSSPTKPSTSPPQPKPTPVTNNNNNNNEDYTNKYLPMNAVMTQSYRASTYRTSANQDINMQSNDINLQPLEEARFDDGTKFIMMGYIGSGQQTYAYSISIARFPKVLKLLQNDESMKELVVTPAEFTINTCYPFNGESREDDYNNYLSKYNLRDDDEETLEEYFDQIVSTFTSWEVKEYNGKQYSISELFDVINASADEKRDCIRFCYFYYLLQKMKIAHCDVAPRNVLLTFEGPVLIDFGASVKFKNVNLNALPYDVTPAYYMDNRVGIRRNHDVKGFYYTATKYFPNVVPYDEAMIAQLDERNLLKVEDIILSHCH